MLGRHQFSSLLVIAFILRSAYGTVRGEKLDVVRAQAESSDTDSGRAPIKTTILNRFPYPVSLVWRNRMLPDEPLTVVVDNLIEDDLVYSHNGHRFEVFKQGTDAVVDYFQVITEDENTEFVIEIGPLERCSAKILNGFPYPVSLYWVSDQDELQTRELVKRLLKDVYEFESFRGHRFEIVELETGEVVRSFEMRSGDHGRDCIVLVGPSGSKIPNDIKLGPLERCSAKVLNGFPYPVSLYWVSDQDELQTRELMNGLLEDVYEFESFRGHRFEIVELETGEAVDSFEMRGGDHGRDCIVLVGPSVSKIPDEDNANENSQIDDLSNIEDEL